MFFKNFLSLTLLLCLINCYNIKTSNQMFGRLFGTNQPRSRISNRKSIDPEYLEKYKSIMKKLNSFPYAFNKYLINEEVTKNTHYQFGILNLMDFTIEFKRAPKNSKVKNIVILGFKNENYKSIYHNKYYKKSLKTYKIILKRFYKQSQNFISNEIEQLILKYCCNKIHGNTYIEIIEADFFFLKNFNKNYHKKLKDIEFKTFFNNSNNVKIINFKEEICKLYLNSIIKLQYIPHKDFFKLDTNLDLQNKAKMDGSNIDAFENYLHFIYDKKYNNKYSKITDLDNVYNFTNYLLKIIINGIEEEACFIVIKTPNKFLKEI